LCESRATGKSIQLEVRVKTWQLRYEAEDDGGDGVERIGAELAAIGSQEVGIDLAEHM
jgi:hypothetical protein